MPDAQTLNEVLKSYGVSNPLGSTTGGIDWGYWIANILFGIIGWYAFIHGKKEKNYRPMVIGITLMVYPYFITNTFWAFAVGFALCAALYFWRE
jgi:hypothetical protein